jgi:hypothetical protein
MAQGQGGGGGKFLEPDASVSTLRFQLSAQAAVSDANTFTAYSGITGGLSAFNYATRSLIESTSFSFFQGVLLGGGDAQVSAEGRATVNGMHTKFVFNAAVIDGAVSFEITNPNTGEVLAGGMGEEGRSALSLTITLL